MLEQLTELLFDWCSINKLDYLSADDLYISSYNELTQSQRDWLTNYIAIWDATQEFEVDINTNKLETFIPTFHD